MTSPSGGAVGGLEARGGVCGRLGPTGTAPAREWRLWLLAVLTLSSLYAARHLALAFRAPYVVQNDGRQHVFWMSRFVDPGLFPNDPIADYFQSIAPLGYRELYHAAAVAGLDPFTFEKILPAALGLMAAGYAFALARRMLNVPLAAGVAAALVTQGLWVGDDLPSGTPRAFAVPLTLAFLYYLSRRSWLPCLTVLALLGLFLAGAAGAGAPGASGGA